MPYVYAVHGQCHRSHHGLRQQKYEQLPRAPAITPFVEVGEHIKATNI